MPRSDHRQWQRQPSFCVLTVTSPLLPGPQRFHESEHKVVADFAEDFYMTDDANVKIFLQAWNKIRAWQEARESRNFLIKRSGIACKL